MAQKFTKLPLQEKKKEDIGEGQYRIYKNKTEFVTVEATFAAEAIEKSGIKDPYRVTNSSES